jgi:hypothetical protein
MPPPLHLLLTRRFAATELQQLVAYNEDLATAGLGGSVDFNQAQEQVAFALINAAGNRGLLPKLAEAAVLARPLAPESSKVVAQFGLATGVTAVANPAQVQFAAGQFNGMFLQQKQQLRRLKEYKGLHDILHQVRTDYGELYRLVQAASQPGYNPLFAGQMMPDKLSNWLRTASSLDRAPNWVPGFLKATRLVARHVNGEAVPVNEVESALELLGALPADQQPNLNDRLVDAARDLNVDGLDTPLHDLQLALGPAYGNEFQQRYDEFRATCTTLGQLIKGHDLCQEVDALIAKASVRLQTPDAEAPQWGEIKDRLGELEKNRPGNKETITRLSLMVEGIAQKGPAVPRDWVPNLQAVFGELFFNLDAELLDATDRVLHTADVLNFHLRGYSQ